MSTKSTDRDGQRIVVGVDGSPDARRALAWAIAHANRDGVVELVNAWEQPIAATQAGLALDPALFAESAASILEREINLLDPASAGPQVTTRVVHGHPGRALLDAAAGADLLVVGSRGHGGFTGLLLGSTSTYLAHHAPCPLVIVPGTAR